jgi:hypothetical protein
LEPTRLTSGEREAHPKSALSWLNRLTEWKAFLLLCCLLLLLTCLVDAAVLVSVWTFGGWKRGPYVDWAAVEALGTIGAAFTSVLVAGGIYFVFVETRERREQAAKSDQLNRLRHGPYVRVDLAIDGFKQPHLILPPVQYVYTAEDLQLEDELKALSDSLGPAGGDGLGLRLYLQNLQSQPLAIAAGIVLKLGVKWIRSGSEGSGRVEVTVRYLAPGQTFCLQLGEIARDVERLTLKTLSVRYTDINDEVLFGAHGAIDLLYYVQGGRAHGVNQRGTVRSDERGD